MQGHCHGLGGDHHRDHFEDVIGGFLCPDAPLSVVFSPGTLGSLGNYQKVQQSFKYSFIGFTLFKSNSEAFINLPPRQLTVRIQMLLQKFFQNDAFTSLRLYDLKDFAFGTF